MAMAADSDAQLRVVEDKAAELTAAGKPLEALKYLERGLMMRRETYGLDSEEVADSCRCLASLCNQIVMDDTSLDEAVAFELLKKAELLTEPRGPSRTGATRMRLRATTFNNLACHYRREGKLRTALSYLEKAERLESGGDSVGIPDRGAATHLNMCAVLSQLGRHSDALQHAQEALRIVEGLMAGGAGADEQPSSNAATMYAIACHNLGVEQEYLQQYEACLDTYLQGLEWAEKNVGLGAAITGTLRTSYTKAVEYCIHLRKKEIAAVKAHPRDFGCRKHAPLLDRLKTTGAVRSADGSAGASAAAEPTPRGGSDNANFREAAPAEAPPQGPPQ